MGTKSLENLVQEDQLKAQHRQWEARRWGRAAGHPGHGLWVAAAEMGRGAHTARIAATAVCQSLAA